MLIIFKPIYLHKLRPPVCPPHRRGGGKRIFPRKLKRRALAWSTLFIARTFSEHVASGSHCWQHPGESALSEQVLVAILACLSFNSRPFEQRTYTKYVIEQTKKAANCLNQMTHSRTNKRRYPKVRDTIGVLLNQTSNISVMIQGNGDVAGSTDCSDCTGLPWVFSCLFASNHI